MDIQLFDQATSCYERKDYTRALGMYSSCLRDANAKFAPGEIGLLYHRIGNCFVKLKNPTEAVQAYSQAASDPSYSASGALHNNIGMAYASMKDYENAVIHFEQAIEDPNYETPYKAYMGLGNTQLKLGRSAEAGVAFREAALDEKNPDPARALLNLGICFMALGRPSDALVSYDSALQFSTSEDTYCRLNASRGQAFVACGQMQEAVAAFETALSNGTYRLSDSAQVDYQTALASIGRRDSLNSPGNIQGVSDMSGFDVSASGMPIGQQEVYDQNPFYYDRGFEQDSMQYPGYLNAYEGDDDKFFQASEDEIEQISRNIARRERKLKNIGLKVIIGIIIVCILALGAATFLYMQGFGWPTQESVVSELFASPDTAYENVFSSSVTRENASAMLAPVVEDPDVQIDGMNRSVSDTVVYATATTDAGGEITYEVTLVRDLLGWKVSRVELYFASQHVSE